MDGHYHAVDTIEKGRQLRKNPSPHSVTRVQHTAGDKYAYRTTISTSSRNITKY